MATIGVLDAARRYAATNERFDKELKALSASATMEHKRLVEMCKNRAQRPIEQDWEKMLDSYDIRYHFMNWLESTQSNQITSVIKESVCKATKLEP